VITVLGIMAAATIGFFGVTEAHLGRLRGEAPTQSLVMIVVGALFGAAMLVRAYQRAAKAVSL